LSNSQSLRQAAAALLTTARTADDPAIAAKLVDLAANLKDQVGELPAPETSRAPDILTE